jgi:hypothetical protein
MKLSPEKAKRLEQVKRLREDFTVFAPACLKIRTKDSRVVPFVFNEPQEYLHEMLEKQRRETGKVRALVLKGRQQGVSTYTGGRFYGKSSMRKNINVYIMAHSQDSSDALFGIVDRYHTLNPLAPHTGRSNVKELVFDKLGSSYIVGTAGQKAGGRGRTITLYHGSEVAFWNNAAEHFAASIQAVPDAAGTEVILESTANGPAGEFYERWQDAVNGRSDYQAIFIPWFWSKEYQRPDLVDESFELSDASEEGELSEVEYAEAYGLNDAQMAWRRNKIRELRSERLFKQEYPANPQEAFQSSQTESFIPSAAVLRARKRENNPAGPLILGVDPAGPGGDRFSVYGRRGLGYEFLEHRDNIETNEAVEWLVSMIDEHDPAMVNIDSGGIGAAVVSVLRARGEKYRSVVNAVDFGGRSQHRTAKPKVPGPYNRRAEMWQRAYDALMDEEMPVSIPDRDDLHADLIGPQVKHRADNWLQLESKPDMKKRGVRSPDLGDSFVLTYADIRRIKNYTDGKPKPVSAAMNPDAPAVRKFSRTRSGSYSWMG